MDSSFAGRSRLGRPARSGSAPWAVLRRLPALPHLPVRISFARGSAARRALVAFVVALPLLAGGWLWLRDSSFVAVQNVRVSGVHGPQAAAIEGALVDAAHHMSTLDVSSAALRAAVAPFAVVREVRASPSFPHGLSIRVVEQVPVAALVLGGSRTAVAADGVVLGPGLLSGSLPTLAAGSLPMPGRSVSDPALLAALVVLGAAPHQLQRSVADVFTGPRGLTVAMHSGLLVYFGDAGRPHAKWFSLARVLSDPSSTGASYVDVRLPSRPAAGFPGGVPPAGSPAANAAASGTEQAGATQSPVGALAAGLSAGGGAGSSPAGTESPSSPATATTPAAPSETPAGAGASEAPAATATAPTTSTEATAPPSGEAAQGGGTPSG
jgi:cell division protein FtsQ